LPSDQAMDTRHAFGGAGVKTGNFGVWIGRTKEHQKRLIGQTDIVGVLTGTHEELLVFEAFDRLATAKPGGLGG